MIDVPSPTSRGNIAIVDPRRLAREALQQLLEAAFFRVAGAGKTLAEAFKYIIPDEKPDLVIYNFDSDGQLEQGLFQIAQSGARYAGVKSVVLTDCTQAGILLKAVQVGADAILSKDISAGVLRRAIEFVLLGQRLLPIGIAETLLQPARHASGKTAIALAPDKQPAPGQGCVATLSRREHQILRCLVNGLSNKIIARELDITEATVKVHVKGLLRKTQMANRTQAAVWGLNNSL
jgi:two-component system nitrate/nitrite response regulator NarL